MSATTQTGMLNREMMVMRSFRDSFRAWCERCCEVVLAVEPDSTARIMCVDPGTLEDLLAANEVHVVETGARSSLICGNSITHQCATAFGSDTTAQRGK